MIEAATIHYHRRMTGSTGRLLTAWLFVLLCGCSALEPAPTPIEPLTAEQKAMLIELEYAALDALNRKHISSPRADSAEDLYQQMLAIDPTNETASRGIERVVEHHINAALDALASRQTTLATNALAKARRLDPSHPSIAPTEYQLQLLAKAEFVRIDLPGGDLREQAYQTMQRLDTLAARLEKQQQECRFTIAVTSDAQGRYVYQLLKQQLAERATNQRLRAGIVISSPNRVEGTCY